MKTALPPCVARDLSEPSRRWFSSTTTGTVEWTARALYFSTLGAETSGQRSSSARTRICEGWNESGPGQCETRTAAEREREGAHVVDVDLENAGRDVGGRLESAVAHEWVRAGRLDKVPDDIDVAAGGRTHWRAKEDVLRSIGRATSESLVGTH